MFSQSTGYLCRPVGRIIIDDDDLVKILAVHLDERLDQWRNVHLLVVTGHNDRGRSIEMTMFGQADEAPPCRFLRGLCQPEIERSTKIPDDRRMFEDKRRRP